jgi:hypothetical protein
MLTNYPLGRLPGFATAFTVFRDQFCQQARTLALLATLCLFAHAPAWAQAPKPVSPEAATQNRQQDIPVSLYTGTAQVGLPIYTFQEGAISIPIGLSYNASGIKQGEPASWCGLGWSLSAGGQISRMVNGMPDEGVAYAAANAAGLNHSKGYYQVGWNSDNVRDDHEPDVFVLNLNGASYKFGFGENRKIHLFNKADVKITPVIKRNPYNTNVYWFSGWEVITADGTKYNFGSLTTGPSDLWEYTVSKEFGEGAPSTTTDDQFKLNPSAWYLQRITSAQGQMVNFNYWYSKHSFWQLAENEVDGIAGGAQPSIVQKINRVYVAAPVLRSIEGQNTQVYFFKEGGINFTGTTQIPFTNETMPTVTTWGDPGLVVRQDLMGWESLNPIYSKILQQIRVVSSGQTLVYDLQHGYFTGSYGSGGNTLPNNYTSAQVGSTHLNRLKLTGLTYPDGTTYSFQYYYDIPGNFPGTLARGRDHWGYPNGATGSLHLIGLGECQGNPGGWAANRTPDAEWSKYGTLQRMTTNTGSETEFIYESHQALTRPIYCVDGPYACGSSNYQVGGTRIKAIVAKDLVSGLHSVREYAYTEPDGQSSSGFLVMKPVYRFNYPVSEGSCNFAPTTFGYNSYLYGQALAKSGKPTVGYGRVTETTYAGRIDLTQFLAPNAPASYKNQFKLGHSIQTFDQENTEQPTCEDRNNQSRGYSYMPWNYRPGHDYRAGNPIKIESFGMDGTRLTTVEHQYSESDTYTYTDFYSTLYRYVPIVYYNNKVGGCLAFNYANYAKRYSLSRQITKTYDYGGTNFTQQTVEYVYKDEMEASYQTAYPGRHFLPVLTRTTDSRGLRLESINRYVADFNFGTSVQSQPTQCWDEATGQMTNCGSIDIEVENIPTNPEAKAIYDLRLKNMLAMPVETQSRREVAPNTWKTLSASYQTYKTTTGLPDQSFALRYFPLTDFTPVQQQGTGAGITLARDSRYLLTNTQESYNSLGLVTATKPNFGPRTTVSYTSNQLLPLSITQNVNATPNEQHTATYEYTVPMFGASREIAPNGFALRYEFDTAGRLVRVRNHLNQILKEYEYKRKDQ